jgi:glycerophosphoryl diester phosphodiesterase
VSEFRCSYCPEVFGHAGIAHRHEEWTHPEEVAAAKEAAAAERAAEKEAVEQDDRFTKDGFLKATNRRTERPSIFPEMPPGEKPTGSMG